MKEDEAAPILLVRSIEEIEPKAFSPAALSTALTTAASDLRPSTWFLARARYLLNSVLHPYGSVLRVAQLPAGWTLPVCAVAFCLGMATNYLGPSEKIPILLNPIMALVAWNLCLYIILVIWRLRAHFRKRWRAARPIATGAVRPTEALSAPPLRSRSLPWVVRVLFPFLWIGLHNLTLRFHATRKEALSFVKIARRFWSHWIDAARPLMAARWRRLSHCLAIALAAGAIAGMYIRGIFLRYDVIWSSTFITDEEAVGRWIEILFAPALWAARIANPAVASEINFSRLMTAEGAPAALWIHLFVITALLTIIVPRSLLASAQAFAVRRARGDVRVDFDDYFARLIRPQIEALISAEIDQAVDQFAQAMAGFVCRQFYDQRLVPELTRFRDLGGKINDLRERIHQRCEESRGEINEFAAEKLKELEAEIAAAVERTLRTVRQDFQWIAAVGPDLLPGSVILPEDDFHSAIKPIGANFTDAIGASIAASVAVALGTLAGGFGESLEIAILVALLGTSGPVGFLIGALAGLVLGAGAWWWGREQITEGIEGIRLPGKLVSTILWQSRFDRLVEEGRTKCRDVVTARIGEMISPLTARIGAEVWTRLGELWHDKPSRAAPG